MRNGLLVGILAVGGLLTVTTSVMLIGQPAQLTQADLPAPEAGPTRVPTPQPTTAPITIWQPTEPRGLTAPAADAPRAFVPDLIDLNLDAHRYSELGISSEKELAIFRLRCALPVPPRPVYEGPLEGCYERGGGITYLDDTVEAGIMTRQEVNDTFAGLVVQQWR